MTAEQAAAAALWRYSSVAGVRYVIKATVPIDFTFVEGSISTLVSAKATCAESYKPTKKCLLNKSQQV